MPIEPTVRVDPRDIEAIARRAAELVRPPVRHGLVDARTIARGLAVSTSYVYAHAKELGAIRLGQGRKARLRFDLERAREALQRMGGQSVPPAPESRQRARRTRSGKANLPSGVELIEGRR